MGKREKKPNRRRHKGEFSNSGDDFYDQHPPAAAATVDEDEENSEEEEENDEQQSSDLPSKFLLYQQSVQSPKGDISYLQKFFLMYVGGRQPLHFQEDFCGTALLSAEWLKTDTRRTAIGLDFDLEALEWCMDNNMSKLGADVCSRMSLFHGNVLTPLEAKQVKSKSHELMQNISLDDGDGDDNEDLVDPGLESVEKDKPDSLPKRDIVCAFNFSCCCLHKRSELVTYFKNARDALSKRGGIFVMDLYGGASAEGQLKLQRKFPSFTYTWEQAEFDIVSRKTRISLHYHLQKQNRKIRHAFSYSWRLWSLPEIKDCMEEAGFRSVHFWLREMPDASEMRRTDGFGAGRDIKYEQVKSFQQCDAWNAYIVAITLAGFRKGKFSTLVATNVAARGLDINDMQLIVQAEREELIKHIHYLDNRFIGLGLRKLHQVCDTFCFPEMRNLTTSLCWKLVKKEGYIAIWQKPLNNNCYLSREAGTKPPFCDESDDPDNVWYSC